MDLNDFAELPLEDIEMILHLDRGVIDYVSLSQGGDLYISYKSDGSGKSNFGVCTPQVLHERIAEYNATAEMERIHQESPRGVENNQKKGI